MGHYGMVWYYSTEPQRNGIYLFYIIKMQNVGNGDVIFASVLQ